MKKFAVLAIFAVVICLFVATIGVPTPSVFADTLVLDQSFMSPGGMTASINECCRYLAQTFTAGKTGTLAGINLDIGSGSTYPLHIAIHDVINGHPNSILGETTLNSSSAPPSLLITFPQTIPIESGKQYAIVVDYPSAPPPGPYQGKGYWQGAGAPDHYPGGRALMTWYGTWTEITNQGDLHFQTFVLVPSPDSTPPTTVDNAPSAWQKIDFNILLTCTDDPNGSGCKETKYRIDNGTWRTGNSVNITTEGDHLIEYYSTDNSGNQESTKTTHAKLDKTPPTITGNRTPSANADGWNNTDVTVSFACFDTISGIDTCGPTPQTIGSEGAGQSRTGAAVDNAGNTASVTVSNISIDKTKPIVFITSPQAQDYAHTAALNVSWTASDPLSGIATQSATLDGNTVTNGQVADLFFLSLGSHTLTVNATDKAGNANSVSVTFQVVADINSLIAAKERACTLGWIDKQGTCNSLDAKLRAAKESIERGKFDTAKNQLNAFINELGAQKGKAVNQQAYDLWKADALYVLSTLP